MLDAAAIAALCAVNSHSSSATPYSCTERDDAPGSDASCQNARDARVRADMLSDAQLQAVAQLRTLFVNIDPGYLTAAVQAYPHDFSSEKVVSRVSAKLLDVNHGHWPTVLHRDLPRGASSSQAPSSRKKPVTLGSLLVASLKSASSDGRRDKGKGREVNASVPYVSLLEVDETASRNVALCVRTLAPFLKHRFGLLRPLDTEPQRAFGCDVPYCGPGTFAPDFGRLRSLIHLPVPS